MVPALADLWPYCHGISGVSSSKQLFPDLLCLLSWASSSPQLDCKLLDRSISQGCQIRFWTPRAPECILEDWHKAELFLGLPSYQSTAFSTRHPHPRPVLACKGSRGRSFSLEWQPGDFSEIFSVSWSALLLIVSHCSFVVILSLTLWFTF